MSPKPVPGPPAQRPNGAQPARKQRGPDGKFLVGNPGFPGWSGLDAARARKALNSRFLGGMMAAYERGGQAAIDKVMKQQPAIFVKMLTLLVPRELEVTHANTIKGMTDEQIEQAIEAIQALLARQAAGATAKVIDAVAVGGDVDTAGGASDKPVKSKRGGG